MLAFGCTDHILATIGKYISNFMFEYIYTEVNIAINDINSSSIRLKKF